MRLRIRLPEVRPEEYAVPERCPYGCGGRHFRLHQRRRKEVADSVVQEVTVRRYSCLRCGRSFRVHPTGISAHHRSQRLRGIGVLLYVLGLSYGGVADALAALGWAGSKSSVYRDVQAAGEAVERVRRQQAVRRVQVASADATYVICQREEVTIAVALDALAGDVLEVDLVESESADALRLFLQQLQEQFGFEALVTDDQDCYKLLSDELGLRHGLCRAHVNRNVAKLVTELAEQALHQPPPVPPGVQSDEQPLLADLEYVQQLMALRPPDGAAQLAQMLRRYQAAPPPTKGQKASLWYRWRMALLRWWTNWPRLTFDQQWNRQHPFHLDGTNNVAERAIGQWIKERYRTMRTFKRRASVRHLARLIPFLATHPDQPVLASLLAA
jgi:transposase-like protein